MLPLLVALSVAASGVSASVELQKQLLETKRIYVDKLSGGEVAVQIRDMIISSLQRTGRFIITENPERAEVHLRGSAEDLVFTDVFQSSEGIGGRASLNLGTGASNSRDRRSVGASAGVNDNESVRIEGFLRTAGTQSAVAFNFCYFSVFDSDISGIARSTRPRPWHPGAVARAGR